VRGTRDCLRFCLLCYTIMMTDRGVHHAFFYVDRGFFRTKRVAELWAKDEKKPLASVNLNEEDFASIVPAGTRV